MIGALSLSDAMLMAQRGDADIEELFPEDAKVKQATAQRKMAADRRRALCEACVRVFSGDDGQLVLEELLNHTLRRFDNYSSLGLTGDVALQLHAHRDGANDMVLTLLKWIAEGEGIETRGNGVTHGDSSSGSRQGRSGGQGRRRK